MKKILSILIMFCCAFTAKQSFAGCGVGETYVEILAPDDGNFALDGTTFTVTIGGTVVYSGNPATDGSVVATGWSPNIAGQGTYILVSGCYPEGASIQVDYTDPGFGDGTLITPPLTMILGCDFATGIADADAAAGTVYIGTLPFDNDNLTPGTGTPNVTPNPNPIAGCAGAPTTAGSVGQINVSPTSADGTAAVNAYFADPFFPAAGGSATFHPICDVAGGDDTGNVLTGTNGTDISQGMTICNEWVQPNVTGNETGAFVGFGTSTTELQSETPGASTDVDGNNPNGNDCGGGITNIDILDPTDCSTPIVSQTGTVTGLVPGNTYVVCVTTVAGDTDLNGPDQMPGTADDGSTPADGTCVYSGSYINVYPFAKVCPSPDFTAVAELCPNEEDYILSAGPNCGSPNPYTGGPGGPGTAVDGWLEISTSAVPTPVNFVPDANGEILYGDFAANNPAFNGGNPFFDLTCADFPQNLGQVNNSTCDPLYLHMHFITFDYDIDNGGDLIGGEYDPSCPELITTTLIQPEPQAPIVDIAACVWTFTGNCPADLITLTGATAGAVVTGDGTNVVTYQPDPLVTVDDPLTSLTLTVDNGTSSTAIAACDAEVFAIDIPAEPVAAITCPAGPVCEDAAAMPLTATPEPGETPFGSFAFTICGDDFSGGETSWDIQIGGVSVIGGPFAYGGASPSDPATGAGCDVVTFTDIQLGPPAAPGTYPVTSIQTLTTPLDFVILDTWGDGLEGLTCSAAFGGTVDGTYGLVDGQGNVIQAQGAFADDGVCGTGAGNSEIVTISMIAVDNVVVTTGVFAGPGTSDVPEPAPDVNGFEEGQFDPAAAGPGEHGLTYTFTDENGCVDVSECYIDVYQYPVLGAPTVACNADGTYNVTIPASNISTAIWNEILDNGAVGSDLSATPTLPADDPANPLVGAPWSNDGVADGTVSAFTVTATVGTLGAATISADGDIVITNVPAGTATAVTIGAGLENAGCHVTLPINPPCICPTVTDDTANYCDGTVEAGSDDVAAWQMAVEMANPVATPVTYAYSSMMVDGVGVTMPDGLVADGTHTGVDNCAEEMYPVYAYANCGDGTYTLLGTYGMTVYPNVQAPADAVTGCTNTPTPACTDDTFGAVAATPTGGAAIANWDGATYTAQPGDLAGTIDIEVTSGIVGSVCMPMTFTITTPACSAACPDVVAVPGADAVCDGGLLGEITAWQVLVEGDPTNAAAIASVGSAVIYSTDAAATEATPPVAGSATGVHSGLDNCVLEDQVTYAYLLCFGDDAAAGGGDDIYLLLGTHTLTVYPNAQAPADAVTGCANTPVVACTGDTFGAVATNPTGDAAIANWDGVTYTAEPGDAAGTIEIMVTSGIAGSPGCATTQTITTPACPDNPMCMIAVIADITGTCDNAGTPADPDDDTFTYMITVTGSTVGASYSISGGDTQAGLTYGVAQGPFGPFDISAGNLALTITDVTDGTCTQTANVIAPATCSNDMCSITADVVRMCDDKLTAGDGTDDETTYTVIVTGSNTGATFNATVAPDDTNPAGGVVGTTGLLYGTTYVYNQTGLGDFDVTFTDVDDSNCTAVIDQTNGCETVENIPTVGEWGLIMLGLLMSITAIVGIRQRREEEATA